MIAVIFEVCPKDAEQKQTYLKIAAQLRPLLDNIDGFISIERFESLYEPGKILSLSFWRDEQAVEVDGGADRVCKLDGERLCHTTSSRGRAARVPCPTNATSPPTSTR